MTDSASTTVDPATPAPGARPGTCRHRGARAALLVVLLALVGGFVAWWFLGRTYHYAVVAPGVLYRDGNQSLWRFKQSVGRARPKTVVCLVDDDEVASKEKQQFAEELQYLNAEGIRAERIPIRLGGWPTTENVRDFLRLVEGKEGQPVLLHCAQGVRRTGMLVAAYQMSVQGYDRNRAKAAILTFGHSDRTVNDIRRFIDGYDPQQRSVNLPATPDGKEE